MWLYQQHWNSAPDTAVSASDLRLLSEALSRSATWNGKLLQPASWLRVFKTAPWLLRTFGPTLKHSTGAPIAERRISSPRGTRANRLVALGSSSAKKTLATSGRTSRGSSAKANPGKSSSKTSTRIYDSASTKSPASWKAWVTALRADSLARRKQARLIEDSGSSRWPTVTADGTRMSTRKPGTGGKMLAEEAKNWPSATVGDSRNSGRHTTATGVMHPGTTLVDATRHWPTALAQDAEQAGSKKRGSAYLTGAAVQWNTPNSNNGKGKQKPEDAKGHVQRLQDQAGYWPTPVQGDHRSGITGKVSKKNARPLCEAVHSFRPARRTSKHGPGCSCSARMLNPRFVEMLMNVPIGFTDGGHPLAPQDFERWETESCRSLQLLLTRYSGTISTQPLKAAA